MPLLAKLGFNRRERTAVIILTAAVLIGVLVSFVKKYKFEKAADVLSAEDSTFIAAVQRLTESGKGLISHNSEDEAKIIDFTSSEVNINAANIEELERLPGIGPVLAAEIVRYRNTNGPFKNTRSLLAVKGIGPKKLEKLISRITIEDTTTED